MTQGVRGLASAALTKAYASRRNYHGPTNSRHTVASSWTDSYYAVSVWLSELARLVGALAGHECFCLMMMWDTKEKCHGLPRALGVLPKLIENRTVATPIT